jgi:hypothetical protein
MFAIADIVLFCALVAWFLLGIVIDQVVLGDTKDSVADILED